MFAERSHKRQAAAEWEKMFVVSVLIQGLESRMYEEFLEIFFFLFKDHLWQKLAKDLGISLQEATQKISRSV